MLVLIAVNLATPQLDAVAALRSGLEQRLGTTVWFDAVSLASAFHASKPAEQLRIISQAIGAAIDSLEPSTWKCCVVTIPAALSVRAPELAFWLQRKAFSPCHLIDLPSDPPPGWGASAADTLVHGLGSQITPSPPTPPRIETPRLILTIPSESHARAYFDEIIGTAMFDTLVWEGPATPADLAEFASLCAREHARSKAAWRSYGVIDKATNRWIGTVGSRAGDRDPGRFTLGYNLAVRFQGHGYGTEAVGALVDHLFSAQRAVRVDADVFVGNIASRRLLEKLGFSCEATLRSLYPKRGERRDAWVFSLLRENWSTTTANAAAAPTTCPPR